jgi:hypothetical protein
MCKLDKVQRYLAVSCVPFVKAAVGSTLNAGSDVVCVAGRHSGDTFSSGPQSFKAFSYLCTLIRKEYRIFTQYDMFEYLNNTH